MESVHINLDEFTRCYAAKITEIVNNLFKRHFECKGMKFCTKLVS
jgi:hypothetical protein